MKTFRNVITLLGECAFFVIAFPVTLFAILWFHALKLTDREIFPDDEHER